jgi:nucleotide-binding universal stress UspA family protein
MALQQAAEFARREHGVLRGLHVRTADDDAARARADRVMEEFAERTRALAVESTGKQVRADDVAQEIIERARWADLVVINQRRVEGRWDERPLGSIFQTVANNTSCPLLAVPGAQLTPLQRVLVAYDGSPKAREALFIFKHLVSCWHLDGIILSVANAETASEMLSVAKAYVEEEQGVQVGVRYVSGVAHEAIIRETAEENIDLLLMGGYGYQPLLKAVLGSTVDHVLRMAWFPVLICR